MQNRQEAIHSKGFNIVSQRQTYEGPIDYSKIQKNERDSHLENIVRSLEKKN